MFMKKSKFIEIIKKLIEREKKIKEVSTSSATPGYMTPYSFSGKGKMDRRNSIASGSGYQKVNNESINEQSKVIKSISNLAKKNKYGTVTGTQMNGKTANMIMKIYNHPKMKKRQKDLDNLTSDELANLTIDRDVIRILGLNEGKYHDYRNDETLTPRQKIGHSMREVRNALSELNKLIDMNVRLKNELNVDSRSYWKNTHKALGKISERLVKLANKVGKLQ